MMATWSRGNRSLCWALTWFCVLAGCQSTGREGQDAGDQPIVQDRTQHTPADRPDRPAAGADAATADEAFQPEDLWDEMRAGFALNHHVDHPRVRTEISGICRFPGYLENMAPRLSLYMPHIFEQVRSRGLPAELALLPIIESAMNPDAVAVRGPTGLWQIIPATGDRLGIPRNGQFDGRRDPVIATRAALDYLEAMHARLGDWRLTIVAYNTGEGAVRRALGGTAGQSGRRDFWSLRLPRHGMLFVPKILALAALIDQPERCGLRLPALSTAPAFASVPTGGALSIAALSTTLGMDLTLLQDLNPGLNQMMVPHDGPHVLHVPPARATETERWIAGLTERPDRVPAGGRIQIRRGDSLSVLARRHGTDIATLKALNNLVDDRLRAGDYLVVPGGTTSTGAKVTRAVPSSSSNAQRAARTATHTHVIRTGDTLWSLARAYRVRLSALLTANGLKPDAVLRIGQRVKIPSDSTSRR
jgi:membrane-bound lytic murein transglycosylase D